MDFIHGDIHGRSCKKGEILYQVGNVIILIPLFLLSHMDK